MAISCYIRTKYNLKSKNPNLGQTKLMCWGTNPTDPYFSQIQKERKNSQTYDRSILVFLLSQYAIENI